MLPCTHCHSHTNGCVAQETTKNRGTVSCKGEFPTGSRPLRRFQAVRTHLQCFCIDLKVLRLGIPQKGPVHCYTGLSKACSGPI